MSVTVPILPQFDLTNVDCAVFKRMQIVTNPLGGNFIAWGLSDSFQAPGPYHFYVDFGRSASNEWKVLNEVPLVDECFFIDPCQRHYDQMVDYYYRVRLVTPNDLDAEGNPKAYVSMPQQANGLWSKTDWLVARDVVRRELLYQNKKTNLTNKGVLLKRRRWGQLSPTTTEWDTQEILNTTSLVDHGTGIIGGYFRGVNYIITLDAPWSRKIKQDGEVGTVQAGESNPRAISRKGRAVSYPFVERSDVYVRLDSGERYIIDRVASISEVGGIPIVVQLDLHLAPVTDPVYKIPLSGGSSSSSSRSSSSDSSSPLPDESVVRIDDIGEW